MNKVAESRSELLHNNVCPGMNQRNVRLRIWFIGEKLTKRFNFPGVSQTFARHVVTDSHQIKTMEQKLLLRGSALSQWEDNVWYNWPIRSWPMRGLCVCHQSEGAKKSLESCQSWSHEWVDGLARRAQLYWSWLIFLIPVSPPLLSIVMTNNISPRYFILQSTERLDGLRTASPLIATIRSQLFHRIKNWHLPQISAQNVDCNVPSSVECNLPGASHELTSSLRELCRLWCVGPQIIVNNGGGSEAWGSPSFRSL